MSLYPGWWQVLIALLVQAVSAASIFTAYSIVAAPLKAEFQPSHMVLMFGITVTSLTSGVLSPALGSAFDRLSIRGLMLAGASLIALGFLLLSFTQSMLQVVLVYAICMAPGSVLLGPIGCATLLSRWFNRRRGLAMGLASSGGAVGGLFLPPLLQGLIDNFEWRTALQWYGLVIFLFSTPLIAALTRNRPPGNIDPLEQPALTGTAEQAASPPTILSTRQVLRGPTFWLIALMLGSIYAGPMALISNMIQFVATKNIDAAHGALLLSTLSAANFAGKLLFATSLDRISLRLALLVMLSGLGISMLGFIAAADTLALVIAGILCGLASGGATPLWSLILSRVYGPQQIGRIMGIMTFVIMPFTLFSPPLFGWVFDQTGSYTNGVLGYLCLLLIAVAGLHWLRLPAVPDR